MAFRSLEQNQFPGGVTVVHGVQIFDEWMGPQVHNGFPVRHSKHLQLDVAQGEVVRGSLLEQLLGTIPGPLAVLSVRVLAAAHEAGDDIELRLPRDVGE